MEWMELRKFNFSHSNHAVRVDLTAKVKGVAAAEEYFNGLSSAKAVHCVYGALLNCYCRAKMTDKALDLFDKMVNENMVTKPLPFNNLMSLYSGLGMHEKVLVLGEEMKKSGIRPDTCTYNLLMNSHAHLNDIEAAERVFEEMKMENGKECNWTSYSNLANIYIKAGYREKAKLALLNVEREMDAHDREAYHFLISLYAGVSDLDSVRGVWKSLKSTLAVVTNRSYLIVLQALGNLGDIEGMSKCYEEWAAVCSNYDGKLAVAVIRAYLRHDMADEAEAVLETAVLRSSEGTFFYVWEQFMLFYLSKNRTRRALEIMETAASKGHEINWHPRSETIDEFLNYFKREGDVSGAEEFYHLMKRVNCVDARLYESLIETYRAAGAAMGDVRARMEQDGVEVSGEIEHLLASSCVRSSNLINASMSISSKN